ncbi:PPE family protein [Mycobacterium kiyosense]|uniref:PPE family protein n=1 Tax=Mycobacterium kiyosense TaxID=2871094 RepID=UPI001EE170DC
MDFGALPPEVNSLRMYTGPGSAPMLAAMQAWAAVADEMQSAAAAYESVTSTLVSDGWRGPAATAMTAAVAPYLAWLDLTAALAAQTAGQAAAAAAAYDAAFAATVPPAVVTANRVRLVALVATNFLGINAPAIAATEAEYAQMWAQDATAMYAYAASAADAVALTPFAEPTPTTDSAGLAEQSSAVSQALGTGASSPIQSEWSQLTSAVSATVHSLAAPASPLDAVPQSGLLADILNFLDGNDGNPYGIFLNSTLVNGFVSAGYTAPGQIMPAITGAMSDFDSLAAGGPEAGAAIPLSAAGPGDASWTGATFPPAGTGTAVAAGDQATLVGRLSVPPSWASAVEVVESNATPLVGGGELGAAPAAAAPGAPGTPGVPGVMTAGAPRHYGNGPRYGFKLTIMPRPPAAG